MEPPSQDVINLVSHATQDRLKTLVSKLAVISEHRLDIIKTEGQYEVTQVGTRQSLDQYVFLTFSNGLFQDVKGQLRFLEDLDKMEKKRHEDAEREMLLRAAKSRYFWLSRLSKIYFTYNSLLRTKTDDPEKEKMKAKAKELQRIEAEQQR